MTADSAISCTDLTRHYGDVVALDRLNLSVPYGSIFGFLGRNGAGKTTTMRLLTGLAKPTAGRAWVAADYQALRVALWVAMAVAVASAVAAALRGRHGHRDTSTR